MWFSTSYVGHCEIAIRSIYPHGVREIAQNAKTVRATTHGDAQLYAPAAARIPHKPRIHHTARGVLQYFDFLRTRTTLRRSVSASRSPGSHARSQPLNHIVYHSVQAV